MKTSGKAKHLLAIFRRDEGQNLVEYALILIASLMLLFGIVEFSRALYTYHFVSHAAREGARWAMVNGATCSCDSSCTYTPCDNATPNYGGATEADVQNYVTTNLLPPGINSSRITVSAPCGVKGSSGSGTVCADSAASCPSAFPNYPGCTVQVKVEYRFNFIAPIVSVPPITMSSTSEMVIAH